MLFGNDSLIQKVTEEIAPMYGSRVFFTGEEIKMGIENNEVKPYFRPLTNDTLAHQGGESVIFGQKKKGAPGLNREYDLGKSAWPALQREALHFWNLKVILQRFDKANQGIV